MKFVVSSIELFNKLQVLNKVISNKNTLPILDYLLFKLKENQLEIVSSDLETTLLTYMEIENVDGEGAIAIEAKRLNDILKEFPEQPLTFEINLGTLSIDILSENGKYSLVGLDYEDFPELSALEEESKVVSTLKSELFLKGINKSLFAVANDELRPIMNGIFIDFNSNNITFASSDSHKLVRYRRFDSKNTSEASFVLPKKPASVLKSILAKIDDDIVVEFDNKNAIFNISDYKLVCRLLEGKYPSYETVIPADSPNIVIADRLDFYNTLKRVSVFSNQASNLIKIKITNNQMMISAQDIDFSISAYERINCQYTGEEIEIGFKSMFLIEIISNISSSDIIIELLDSSRAGVIKPYEKDLEDEDELMLLMPLVLKA